MAVTLQRVNSIKCTICSHASREANYLCNRDWCIFVSDAKWSCRGELSCFLTHKIHGMAQLCHSICEYILRYLQLHNMPMNNGWRTNGIVDLVLWLGSLVKHAGCSLITTKKSQHQMAYFQGEKYYMVFFNPLWPEWDGHKFGDDILNVFHQRKMDFYYSFTQFCSWWFDW